MGDNLTISGLGGQSSPVSYSRQSDEEHVKECDRLLFCIWMMVRARLKKA